MAAFVFGVGFAQIGTRSEQLSVLPSGSAQGRGLRTMGKDSTHPSVLD